MVLIVCRTLRENSGVIKNQRFFVHGLRNLSKGYVPKEVEPDVISFWKRFPSHPFAGEMVKAVDSSRFSMLLPPPNVTGTLHLGHALTTTLQDVLAKRKCMQGNDVVWVPGLDHAGIATQAIVELVLTASGENPNSMSKNELLEKINTWKESKSTVILNQLRELAPSLDWARLFFTLDQNRNLSVEKAFNILYSDGLIYRAERLVNWSVHLGSTLSDMEVEYKQIRGPTLLHPPSADAPVLFGQMTDVAFKLYDNPDKEVIVSTCRVETMPGDCAVAVHPEDSKYNSFHGSMLRHPLTSKPIPLIVDEAVDPSFGTGAVKVTPGHDHTDFEMARRHHLDIISVINESGLIADSVDEYAGLNRFKARQVMTEVLKEKGFIRQVRDHDMSVPLCSRTGDIIELLSKPQWFLKCKDMATRALDAVEKGDLEIIPGELAKQWSSYLENIRDWCISRQVIWGHRIPLYTDGNDSFTLATERQQNDNSLKQVEDVLDTWFSSALLPFTAFGWPDNNKDVEKYFPLDVMVTGHDILFFWVARMAMLSLQLTDRLPFKRVVLHSVICDPQGRKMSKSLGNVIDPHHIIHGVSQEELLKDVETRFKSGALRKEEASLARSNIYNLFPKGIAQCGTDALRLTLLSHRIKNHYINFDTDLCFVNKLFCNKLWQACRFTIDWSDRILKSKVVNEPPALSRKLDIWLFGKLCHTVAIVNKSIDNYDFHIAVNEIKEFVQLILCDVYLEAVKSILNGPDMDSSQLVCQLLLYSLVNVVKLLAPMAPFVSEKLYQHLQPDLKISVHNAKWPEGDFQTEMPQNLNEINQEIAICLSIVKEIRKLKINLKVANRDNVQAGISFNQSISNEGIELINNLSKTDLQIIPARPSDNWSLFSTLNQNISIYQLLPDSTAFQSQNFDKKLSDNTKKLNKLEKELEKILKMRSHDSYKFKVPQSVQKSQSDKILRLQTEIQQLRNEV